MQRLLIPLFGFLMLAMTSSFATEVMKYHSNRAATHIKMKKLGSSGAIYDLSNLLKDKYAFAVKNSVTGEIHQSLSGIFYLDDGYLHQGNDRLLGYPAEVDSSLACNISEFTLSLFLPPSATTHTNLGESNLNAAADIITAPFNLSDTRSYNYLTSESIYDSLGNHHVLRTYFAKYAANEWIVYFTHGETILTATHLIFDSSGMITPRSAFSNVTLQHSNGAKSPQSVTINMTSMTQLAAPFSTGPTSDMDGNPYALIDGLDIDDLGYVTEDFENSPSKIIGRIALVKRRH